MTTDEPDETASWDKLFQTAFDALDQGITSSLVSFLRSKNENETRALYTRMSFSGRVKKLEELTQPLDNENEYVQHFRKALATAKEVEELRDRHVRLIDAASCLEKIHFALTELDAYTNRLVTDAKVLDQMMNVKLE